MGLTIRNKILLFIIGAISLFSIYAFIGYFAEKSNFEEERMARIKSELTSIKLTLEADMSETTESFFVLGDTPSVRFLARNKSAESPSSEYSMWFKAVEKLFLSYCERTSVCRGLSLISKDGNELIAVEHAGINQVAKKIEEVDMENMKQDHNFMEIKNLSTDNVYISEMMLDHKGDVVKEPHVPIVHLGYALNDSDGNLSEILELDVDANKFINYVVNIKKDYVLMDQDLYFMYHPKGTDFEWGKQLGSKIKGVVHTDNSIHVFEANDDADMSGIRMENGLNDLFDKDGTFVGFNSDGKYVNEFIKVNYNKTDPSRYWIVGQNESNYNFYLDFEKARGQSIYVYFSILIVVIIATIVFGGYIAKPIEKLNVIVEEIKKGNYNVTFPEMHGGELGSLQEELKALVEEMRKKEERSTSFIASVSHQLPTPISRIRLQLGVLKTKLEKLKDNKEAMETFNDIRENNELSVNLTNDVLEVIELGANYKANLDQEVNLGGIITFVAKTLVSNTEAKKINITMEMGDNLKIKGDEERVKSLFFNLIDNAITYSNVNGSISIEATEESGSVTVKVADNGIGIPLKSQLLVFDKFFRDQNAYCKKTVGTGLGLAICKIIAEGHGGKIWFTSKEGEGTTFFVSLPKNNT